MAAYQKIYLVIIKIVPTDFYDTRISTQTNTVWVIWDGMLWTGYLPPLGATLLLSLLLFVLERFVLDATTAVEADSSKGDTESAWAPSPGKRGIFDMSNDVISYL